MEREPENPTALRGLVEARLQLISVGLSDVQELLDPLDKLARLNPQQTQYTVLLAQVQQQAGDPEAAATSYRNILATQPGNLEALQGYVALLLQQQRPTYAIEVLQSTIETAPQANQLQPGSVNVPAIQLLKGQVYVAQQDYAQALELYDRLIAENPQDFRPVYAKAVVLKEQGQSDQAQALFSQAVALAPAQYKDQIQATAQQSAPATPPPATPSTEEGPE
nr:tetratricopeptide repeat protein [Petrachloros mirabilis]